MNAPQTISPLQPSDAASMSALHLAGFEASWSRETMAGLLAEPHTVCQGVWDKPRSGGVGEKGTLAGFVIWRVVAGEAEIITLVIAPPARRQGMARLLVERVILLSKAAGADALFLEVAETNKAALALYQALDFEQVGCRRGYYKTGEKGRRGAVDALVMKLAMA